MFVVSARTLNILAALVWLIGGFVLSVKGASLLVEAVLLRSGWFWPGLAIATGLVTGVIQGRLLFVRNCHKNLDRIAALEQPKIWQFYRPGFFVALAAMIATGAALSRLAQGSYPFLLAVAALDLSLSTALLGSSLVFWQRRAFR